MTVTSRLGIVELVGVCAAEQARSMSLFERVGRWVSSTVDPELQRLFATAAHRHAWHGELWAGRTPTIPVAAVVAGVPAIGDATSDVDRWAAYVTALGSLDADLTALTHRVDPDLDPSTARVVSLVASDVRALAAQLASVHVA